MRSLKDIRPEEIQEINIILKDEYYYTTKLTSYSDIKYQCFSKSSSIYSGYAIIKVYEYLKSVDINIY